LTDETQLKKTLGPARPEDIAAALAEAKACSISERSASELVIGADQVLALAGAIFDKPRDLADARVHLLALRGKTHELHSALACARGGKIIWRCTKTARLTMRSFSEAFIDSYLTRMGGEATRSVGTYKLEGEGIQLFERIEGDISPSWGCRSCRSSPSCASRAKWRHEEGLRHRLAGRPFALARHS
jgi:septum formation protein